MFDIIPVNVTHGMIISGHGHSSNLQPCQLCGFKLQNLIMEVPIIIKPSYKS